MKTLFIIRHAKSSWDNTDLHDIERPLADRGIKDASAMGKLLMKKNMLPDILISSPALRAFSTARIICDEMGIDKNLIAIHNSLYSGDPEIIISLLQSLGTGPDTVFIFGHNPTFTNLASSLCLEFMQELPTCGIVILQFPVNNWSLVEKNTAKLIAFEYPRKNK